ncbi:MAG: ice-binding family protein [Acidimicrobiales bacterium]
MATADQFAVLADETITNIGPTTITGDVGLHPGSEVTNFPPCTPPNCVTLTGELHVADAVALQAQLDLVTAYNGLLAQSPCTSVDVELAGDLYIPGVYCSPGTFNLAVGGIVTLDALGNPDAQFIFLTGANGSTLVTEAGSQVLLIGSAQACNVYWQVASSATIGVASAFVGNILAAESIQLLTAATLQGSALAQNGSVTLDNNTITQGPCATRVSPPVNNPPVVTPPVSTPPVRNQPGGGSSGSPGTRITTTALTTTALTTTGLTTTGLTTTGLTTTTSETGFTEQARLTNSGLAATGVSVRTELLLAGIAIILGSLLLLLSRLRRGSVTDRSPLQCEMAAQATSFGDPLPHYLAAGQAATSADWVLRASAPSPKR